MNALVPIQQSNAEVYRASTDAASLCREIVLQTAMEIQKRRYVKVEGWQAIAIAHGCTASARDVERIDGGVRAIGEVRRMADGALIAQAEGFVGEDEPDWFGGKGVRRWKWGEKKGEKVWYDADVPPRPAYAIRAMAQTRAISRACRSAFAHVVVLIDANLSTTPAEEVPAGGFDNHRDDVIDVEVTPAPSRTAVTAAMTAITLCDTVADLKAWHMKNADHLTTLSGADQDEIARHYKARAKAVAPQRSDDPDAFRGGGSGRVAGDDRDVPQQSAADLIGADEIPW